MKVELNEKQILMIKTFVGLADKMKNCYFFNSPKYATDRRGYEKKHSFEYRDEKLILVIKTTCSELDLKVNCSRIAKLNGEFLNLPKLKLILFNKEFKNVAAAEIRDKQLNLF